MRAYNLSPYTFQPLHADPHPFAKAIWQWTKEFIALIYPDEELSSSSSGEEENGNFQLSILPMEFMSANAHGFQAYGMLSSPRALSDDEMRLQMYLQMAQKAVTSMHLMAIRTLATEAESKVVWLRNFYAERCARVQAIQHQQQTALQNQLDDLDGCYQQKFQLFQNKLDTAQLQLNSDAIIAPKCTPCC